VIVAIFAKAPRAGFVKTRLAAAIGSPGAVALAAAFVEDTWALARSRSWARPVIAAAGDIALPGAELWDQGDGELDARIERVLARAGGAAIALAADSPGLPATILDEAAAHVAAGRAVLGPADDGGFYLLGVPRCPSGLLCGVTWSAPTTCDEVAARLHAHGLEVSRLPPWFDIDRSDDLARLAALLARSPERAPATARALEAL
jgi:glycosyltransferase A (GT-A) superfamily protein (DUF2064 family)